MRSFKTITSKLYSNSEEFEFTISEWIAQGYVILNSGYDRDLGFWVHLQKSSLNFKSSELPDEAADLECQVKKCFTNAEHAATTSQTNCIWYLCNEHNQRMSEGEVWW